MPPNFSLQNVLDIRHSKVEALEIELGKLMAELMNIRAELAALQDLQMDLMDKLAASQTGEINVFAIQLLHSNLVQLDKHIAQVVEKLKKMDAAVEEKRKELVEARQAEETLQILKRKRIEVYNAEQAEKEARNQDDIYIARAFRQQMQGV